MGLCSTGCTNQKDVKIQSIKNPSNVQEVSKEDWDKMLTRGDARNFKVIENSAPAAKPKEVNDYETLLNTAQAAFKLNKWTEAKAGFEKCLAIKETSMVKDRVAKCDQELKKLEGAGS